MNEPIIYDATGMPVKAGEYYDDGMGNMMLRRRTDDEGYANCPGFIRRTASRADAGLEWHDGPPPEDWKGKIEIEDRRGGVSRVVRVQAGEWRSQLGSIYLSTDITRHLLIHDPPKPEPTITKRCGICGEKLMVTGNNIDRYRVECNSMGCASNKTYSTLADAIAAAKGGKTS